MEAEKEEDRLGGNEMEWKKEGGRRRNGGEQEEDRAEEKVQQCAK